MALSLVATYFRKVFARHVAPTRLTELSHAPATKLHRICNELTCAPYFIFRHNIRLRRSAVFSKLRQLVSGGVLSRVGPAALQLHAEQPYNHNTTTQPTKHATTQQRNERRTQATNDETNHAPTEPRQPTTQRCNQRQQPATCDTCEFSSFEFRRGLNQVGERGWLVGGSAAVRQCVWVCGCVGHLHFE